MWVAPQSRALFLLSAYLYNEPSLTVGLLPRSIPHNRGRLRTTVSDVNERLADGSGWITKRSRVETYASRVEAYAPQVEACASRVQACASRVQACAARVETYAARVETYAARVETYGPRVKTCEPRVQAWAAQAEALTARVRAWARGYRADPPRRSASDLRFETRTAVVSPFQGEDKSLDIGDFCRGCVRTPSLSLQVLTHSA